MYFDTPLNIALVGLGKIARDQHLPALRSLSQFKLVAACTPDGGSEDFPVYQDLSLMLSQHPEIDAISICTPPQVRHEIAKTVIAAGKHVMLEKPPAATLGEAEAICRLANDQQVSLFATWHSRFAPAVDAARRWISERNINQIDIVWKENVRQWHKGQQWIFNAGGMGVFDPGINAFSILTRLVEGLVLVKQANLFFPTNGDCPIRADITMKTELGVPIYAEFDFLEEINQTWSILVQTDQGEHLDLCSGGAKLSINGKLVIEQPEAEYVSMYKHFEKLIREGLSDADFSPLRMVSDSLSIGKRWTTSEYFA